MRVRLIVFLAVGCLASGAVRTDAQQRPRARELGIAPGIFAPGPLNAITDVPGVRVGQITVIKGDSIRTGVTAIVPHPGNLFQEKVPAAIVVGNGFGKLIGSTQVNELGVLETPIILTNTLSVWEAAATLADYTLNQPGNERVVSVNPVVGETNDGWLNDIRRRALQPEHFLAPGNAEKVEAAFRDEIRKTFEEGFRDDELEAAKQEWLDARQLSRSKDPGLADLISSNLYFDRQMAWHAELEQRVRALTPARVNAAARAHLNIGRMTIVTAREF